MRRISAVERWLLRLPAAFASRNGPNGSLLILTYHRVLPEPDPLLPDEPDGARFRVLVDAMRQAFNILPLRDAVALRREGRLPARALSLTFDDGYANNAEIALPILTAYGVRATFFVATGYLNGGRMWNDSIIEAVRESHDRLDLTNLGLGTHELGNIEDRRYAIGRILDALKYRESEERARIATAIAEKTGLSTRSDLMMTDGHVRRLVNHGMEVGAHTVSHPILARVDSESARNEIVTSKAQLAKISGAPVSSFAYPNGRPATDYRREHVRMVREAGFEYAVSTAWGCATAQSDPYQLPRISPWGTTAARYLMRMVRSYLNRRSQLA